MTNLRTVACSLVSVVIPAYNAEDWIEETLSSAMHQSHRKLEIIVVDDGSSDATVAIVQQLAANDKRIRLVSQANGGVGRARNHGIRLAKGAYIAPLDADDLWRPDKIEKQLQRFDECAAAGAPVGLVYCWSQSIDQDSRILRPGQRGTALEGNMFNELLLENFVGNGSSPLIDSDVLDQVGGYQEQMPTGCEDWTLYLAIAHEYPFAAVPACLVGYRQLSNSMSKNIQRMLDAHRSMVEIVSRKYTALPDAVIRDSRNLLLYWMLTSAKKCSIPFFSIIKRLFINDMFFLLRPPILNKLKAFILTRVFRVGYESWMAERPHFFVASQLGRDTSQSQASDTLCSRLLRWLKNCKRRQTCNDLD